MTQQSSQRFPPIPAVMSDPFEWIFIPSGSVGLVFPPYYPMLSRDPIIVEVEPFYIAKYLVTNEQYAIYVRETGRKPEHTNLWDKSQFNQPLQPVIDLRWQEAMLFCQWLSHKAGYLITLPTHAQWQRAAQGDDNRHYPWGNEWDVNRCNTGESRIGHTTPVTTYPQGASPYGVMDMVGNACEWCLTNAKTGSNSVDWDVTETDKIPEKLMNETFIFRGGSFNTSTRSVDVIQYGATPIFWPYLTGIRLVTETGSIDSSVK
ncbi:MAG: SUMF1/EgtB/PvdO family nonheme iron enzyme [Anaerolineae bacterium]|nr:SUMF1/EgtB/PvdO family nonheme iron enzyme [Anaerolineae bacterium]